MRCLLLTLCLLVSSEAARILATVFSPSLSHQLTFRPLWKELSRRGHHITLLTTDPMKDPTLTNISEIDLSESYKIMDKWGATEVLTNHTDKMTAIKIYLRALAKTADWQLAHTEVQRIVRDKTTSFDLIMVEVAYPTHMGFADRFKVPMIGLTSFEQEHSHQRLGNLIHPVAFPNINLPYLPPLTYKERLISGIYHVVSWLNDKYYLYPSQTETARKHLGSDIRNLEEIEADMSMLFVTLNPAIMNVRPIGLNTIIISGMHLQKTKPLPKELQTFMDNSKRGVVLFSLGTNIKTYLLNENMTNTFLKAFAELPYDVLFKYDGDDIQHLPKNVKMLKWVPQQDLLGHPNMKLFITQCGLQSLEEAVVNRVPIVAIPFIPEQRSNAMVAAAKGIGLTLDKDTITKDTLRNAVLQVINNSTYKERATELGRLSMDIEKPGLEKAVWWTEYCLRTKGAKHLKNPISGMPLYQILMIDVIGTALLIALIIFVIIFVSVKLIIRLVKSLLFRKSKIKAKKA